VWGRRRKRQNRQGKRKQKARLKRNSSRRNGREERRFRATTAGQQPWENTLTARLLTQTKATKERFQRRRKWGDVKGKTSRKTYLA
jgi:hypothetical protein